MATTTTKIRALTLRPHEAAKLAKDGSVLIVREMTPQPSGECAGVIQEPDWGDEWMGYDYSADPSSVEAGDLRWSFRDPFGPVGSPLWGREDFYDRGDYSTLGRYAANRYAYPAEKKHDGWLLHKAVTMPRAASRFPRLVHESSTAKPVQGVTEEEATAAGMNEDLCLYIPRRSWRENRWHWFATVRREEP